MAATADSSTSTGRVLPGVHHGRSRSEAGPITPLDLLRVVVDVDGLQVGVDVARLRAGLAPAVDRLPQAAKRHVRLAAVGAAVYYGHAGLDAVEEGHCPMDAACV